MKRKIQKNVIEAVAFAGLGKRQKYIVNKMVLDDYFILETLDTSNFHTTIELVDDYSNYDIKLTKQELDALFKRGFLEHERIRMSLQLEQDKYYFKEEFVEYALNFCCDI